MKRLKRSLILIAFLALISSVAFANGLNLNGLGARAVAMGGAFVGLADDYTAIYWNPAGLAGIKKTAFGVTGSLIIPNQGYKFDHPVFGINLVDAKAEATMYPAGLAGLYFPVTEKLTMGIGVYTPSGLGAKWKGEDFMAVTNGKNYELLFFIGTLSISPVIAYEINEQISVGATLNLNYGMFSVSRWAGMGMIPFPPYPSFDLGQYEEDSTGWGVSGTFGLLVKPSEQFSFGVTYRTASKVKMSGDASIEGFSNLMLNTKTEFEREVTSPMWLAAGIAIKPTDKLTLTADAQYTNWGKLDTLHTEFKDTAWQAVMKLTEGDTIKLDWKDKIQWRFGLEYLLSKWALRAGYYYDPAPAPDETLTVLMPSFDYNVITFGFGYAHNGFILDCAAEYLMGKDRDIEAYPNIFAPENNPGLHTMNIWSFELGLGFGW